MGRGGNRGGRGRGGNRGDRGGGGRGRGGNRGSGGRGNSKFNQNTTSLSKRDIHHLHQFGEQHPSTEIQDFGGDSLSKKPRFDKSRDRGGRGRGGSSGFGNRNHEDGRNRNREEEDRHSSSESEDEQVTPYDEMLSMFAKSKGDRDRKEIQIVSDEEEEDDEEEDLLDEDEIDEKKDMEKLGSTANKNGEILKQGEDSNDSVKERDQDQELDKVNKQLNKAIGKDDKSLHTMEQINLDELNEDKIISGTDVEETVIVEAELDPELNEDETTDGESEDPFLLHFEREMSEILQTHVKAEKPQKIQESLIWPELDKFNYIGFNLKEINEEESNEKKSHSLDIDLSLVGKAKSVRILGPPPNSPNTYVKDYHIKTQILNTLPIANQAVIDKEMCPNAITPLQRELLSLASQYYDIYYPTRTILNAEAIRVTYCAHAANHIIKTRTRILHHNAKMANKVDVPDAYRDQGFVRPKVLILAPFKDSALKIVKTLITLFLEEEKGNVANKKRFLDEYGGSTLFLPKTNPKPDDYNETFSGNNDDNFKIGISLTKKTVKLYTGFYGSDIIVASPLGLRLIVGAEGERDRDYDFLSSIELVIMDQADIFSMQNWDHVLHLMKHLHLQPITTHGTDFARIRPSALDGLTKFYCQTLIFSSVMCPEHCALMSRYCQNYAGRIRVMDPLLKGSISQVTVQLPQVFQYFESNSLGETDDARFEFFIKKVLPTFKEKLMSHTMIFVSSYFDFVRLRNHFKREEETRFVQICEYTKDKKLARARDYFFHGQSHFLLYTERAHFFRRFRLKGIGHIVFYQLPQYSHFYSELCNFIREDFQNKRVRQRKNSSVNVMYCKYDTPRLAAIVGSERAGHMLSSDKTVHAFVSGEF